ncbi:hypothetical protein [Microbulbifer taiwanensis]|uniref:YtxH domain-containing protein n=1 Tax=Microbulbifer taiwanensis TaxID=986746 RepID=A0ABW1YI11_9GAMM|nr:hypothetical protein [Microbulbifer taiwanensis]
MKKIIIPAIVIAAIGGYFYYQNMEPATSEAAIAKEVESAVEQAGEAMEKAADETVVASNELMEVEGDVFADAPEHMMGSAEEAAESMEAAAEEAEEMTEEAMDEMPEEDIDHTEE